MKNKMYLNVAITFLFACLMASTSFAQLTSNDGNVHLRDQSLFGDNASALFWNSNNSNSSQLIFQDKEGDRFGKVLGSQSGLYFGLTDGDNNWTFFTKKDEFSAFRIDNVEKMRILVNGKVGIGTSAPVAKLHVTGSVRSSNGNDISEYLEINHGGWNSNISHFGDGAIRFRLNGETKMVLNADGNLGIGTDTPDNKLDVKGTIRAEEVKVELGWSDYVFYDDYQLPTLEEEEEHIEENGHLLGFESEEDMAGEIQLGDVSKRQQAKIEEIMLHLIELKKQNDELKEEIETLKKENDELEKEMEVLETKVEK